MGEMFLETDVLIIGGGVTGTGIARDLALRGIPSLLVEKGDINAGASGANHGLLHSGARYVSSDFKSAAACRKEGKILKKVAPHCIDDCGGLFIAVKGDDENYIADFPMLCEKQGLFTREMPIKEVLENEPALSKNIIAAFQVKDASIDPFMLSLENIAHAGQLGAEHLCHTKVEGFEIHQGRIVRVRLIDTGTGKKLWVEPGQVVNATGAWAAGITALAGIKMDLLSSMGTLLVTQPRITRQVINRLRPPSDADILVPGGTVSLVGTTSVRVDDPDGIFPTVRDADLIVCQAAQMVPALEKARFVRAYSGVRPLVGNGEGDDRRVSRSYLLLDHGSEGLKNFVTITGGKLTTFRLMAEKTSDLIASRLGNTRPCLTRTEPLPETMAGKWTRPGAAPRQWLHKDSTKKDKLLCECEMVSESAINKIALELKKNGEIPDLLNLGKRSRLGKGACQGTFCSVRVLAHLYHQGELEGTHGIEDIKRFLNERWKGQRPIYWGDQLIQAEITEAMHCGLFDLELA